MKTEFTNQFDKDVNKIFDGKILNKIEQIVIIVEETQTLWQIPQLLKMKGYRTSYRIRVGKFRIGVEIIDDLVIFVRCLPRKDFYKFFP